MKKFHGHEHGLKLGALEDSGEELMCSVCELEVSGEGYSCAKGDCDFILHNSCSEIPKTFRHKSDPDHTFSLISEPPKYSLYFDCNACGDLIRGFGFLCDADGCGRRMHVKCAFLPESVECKAHTDHDLHLYYTESKPNSDGYSFFTCDVCAGGVTEGYWSYYCKDCDFGTHLECAASAEAVVPQEEDEDEENGGEEEDKEEENGGEEEEEEDDEDLPPELQLARARMRMEQQRMNLEFQMRMARQNAEFMNSLANSWRGLL